jgi:hypothetical protein
VARFRSWAGFHPVPFPSVLHGFDGHQQRGASPAQPEFNATAFNYVKASLPPSLSPPPTASPTGITITVPDLCVILGKVNGTLSSLSFLIIIIIQARCSFNALIDSTYDSAGKSMRTLFYANRWEIRRHRRYDLLLGNLRKMKTADWKFSSQIEKPRFQWLLFVHYSARRRFSVGKYVFTCKYSVTL